MKQESPWFVAGVVIIPSLLVLLLGVLFGWFDSIIYWVIFGIVTAFYTIGGYYSYKSMGEDE